MSAARESSEIEKHLSPLIQMMRSLDKVTWYQGNGHNHGFVLVKEHVEEFDVQWQDFKNFLTHYEKEQFIKKL